MAKKPPKWAHVVRVNGCAYAVCKEGLNGAFVRTGSGRVIQFPKMGKDLYANKLFAFLCAEAIGEANAMGDAHAADLFASWQRGPKPSPRPTRRAKAGSWHMSWQMDDVNDYLFDAAFAKQVRGPRTISAPLSAAPTEEKPQ